MVRCFVSYLGGEVVFWGCCHLDPESSKENIELERTMVSRLSNFTQAWSLQPQVEAK